MMGVGCGGNGKGGAAALAPEVVYVSEMASDGNGTLARPFAQIAPAIQAVREGGVVVLSAGNYLEEVAVDRAVTVTGVDRAGVVVRAIRVGAVDGAVISNLTVKGGEPGVIANGARLTLDGVAVEGAGGVGVSAKGGKLTMLGCAVRATRGLAQDGHGVFMEGGEIDVRSSDFVANEGRAIYLRGVKGDVVANRVTLGQSGIAASSASAVRIADNEIDLPRPTHITQVGVFIGEAKAVVEGNSFRSLSTAVMLGSGGDAIVRKNRIIGGENGVTIVNGVATLEENDFADTTDRAISVQTPSGVTILRKNTIARAGASGISVYGAIGVRIEENDVSATKLDSSGLLGFGVYALYAKIETKGNRLTANAGGGIGLHKATAVVDGDTIEANDGPGVMITELPAEYEAVSIANVTTRGNLGVGLLAIMARARVVDSRFDSTRFDAAMGVGDGIAARAAEVTAARVTISGSAGNGVFVAADSKIEMSSSAIEASERLGMMAACAAIVTLTDVAFRANRLGDRNPCQ